jgi:hypothetical protein
MTHSIMTFSINKNTTLSMTFNSYVLSARIKSILLSVVAPINLALIVIIKNVFTGKTWELDLGICCPWVRVT